jgi:hypothetical protein
VKRVVLFLYTFSKEIIMSAAAAAAAAFGNAGKKAVHVKVSLCL